MSSRLIKNWVREEDYPFQRSKSKVILIKSNNLISLIISKALSKIEFKFVN